MAPNRMHLDSLLVGMHTLRINPLRTMLSTLGVIIGVAALVAVLSLGDSLEAFSRRQIEETTDLQSVTITSKTVDRVDGMVVPRQHVALLGPEDVAALQQQIDGLGNATLTLTRSDWIALVPEPLAGTNAGTARQDSSKEGGAHPSLLIATLPDALSLDGPPVVAGRFLAWSDFEAEHPVAVLSHRAALQFVPEGKTTELIGRSLQSGEQIIGVLGPRERPAPPTVFFPFDVRNQARLQDAEHTPTIVLRANDLESVAGIVAAANTWVESREDATAGDFSIASSSGRVDQAAQAMMVFKLALGSIAAISLIVGGIGIMNILLASVTERTREIGIRRATGARKRHILIQFLSESVIISVLGSVVGAAIGVGATFLITTVIETVTEASISAVFSLGSLLFAALAAIAIGLAFGTYPARRAARIEPAVAMRYE